jgi:hypothetical protein
MRRIKKTDDHAAMRVPRIVCAWLTILYVSGCSRAPTFNILGSFFPSWILCGVLGLLLAVGVRLIFVKMKFEQDIAPLILVYPCLAAFFTFTIWLVFFS